MSELESPAAAVMPETPVVPDAATPVVETPAAPAPVVPADDTAGQQQDNEELSKEESEEWDKAADEIFPGLKSANAKKEEKKADEQAESKKDDETTTTTTTVVAEKTDAEKQADQAAETAKTGDEETEQSNSAVRDARAVAREAAKELEDVKADIRQQLFADQVPEPLKDKDGNEIKTAQDVMQYTNPATKTEENPDGRLFTQEEAQAWLDYQNSENNKKLSATEQEVEHIANATIKVADEADAIGEEFGELLKADPDLQKKLWAGYRATLKMRRGTNAEGKPIDIIVDAPVSLDGYYRPILEKEAERARQLEKDADDQAAKDQAEKDRVEKERKESRQDRSPIYGGGEVDTRDDEAKGWDAAAQAVFGPQLNQLNRK